MTREEAIKNHRKMWNWIADQYENGSKNDIIAVKRQYLETMNINPYPSQLCFLCQFCIDNFSGCEMCPVIWKNFECSNSEYGRIYELTEKLFFSRKKAAKIARIIANLPERSYRSDKK